MSDDKNYTELGQQDTDQAEDFFDEEENDMVEKKHPVKDFFAKHKTKIIVGVVGTLAFIGGCALGGAAKKEADSQSDSSDEIDMIESENSADNNVIAEAQAEEITTTE